MRSYEFENQINGWLMLGESATAMGYYKFNDHYVPAVLCVNTEIVEDGYYIKSVNGMIYWDEIQKRAVRKNFSYEEQKEITMPIKAGTVSYDEDEEDTEEPEGVDEAYYINIDKIGAALDVGCVTSGMKKKYREMMAFDRSVDVEKLFKYFFPEAMEILLG